MRVAVLALVIAVPCGPSTRATPSPAPQPEPAAPQQSTDEELKSIILYVVSPKCGVLTPAERARSAERCAPLDRSWHRVPGLVVQLVEGDSCPLWVLKWAQDYPLPESHVPLRDALRRWRERLDWPGHDRPAVYGDECVLARLRKGVAPPSHQHPDWDLVDTFVKQQWGTPRPADECGLGRSMRRAPIPAPRPPRSDYEEFRWQMWEDSMKVLFTYFARIGDASDLAWMERMLVMLGYRGERHCADELARMRTRLRAK